MSVTSVTQHTAKNQFVDAPNGVRFAYRRFGRESGTPVLFLQHFRGDIDNWDPAVVDAIAAEREVILLDNRGVGLSSGTVPATVTEMARDVIAFTDALGLETVDLLGFSLGGFVAQEVALIRPPLVRRLVLTGTGPRGGVDMHGWRKDIADHARNPDLGGEDLLYIFFAHTDSSQAKGMEYLGRFLARTEERDIFTTLAARDAQYDAIVEWGVPDHAALSRLRAITQPTLITQGDNDLMIPTPNSHLMAGLIPGAELHIYEDASHASLFQYPERYATDVNTFLGRSRSES
ncbi:alpha/beta fold hydrolase [Streptomyces sp. NPDC087420]|uniref:alpha/beta fold hydrolase n=1 Tax=Streptomyces sp. NPDC087420 TaxID=3365785 RepID=UPI003836FDBE